MNFKSEVSEPKNLYNGKYHHIFTIGPRFYEDDGLTKYDDIEYLTSKEYLENNFSKSLDFEILFNMLIQDKQFEDILIARIYIKSKFDIAYNSPEEYIEDISKYYTIIKIDNGWMISNYDGMTLLYYDKIKRHINKSNINVKLQKFDKPQII